MRILVVLVSVLLLAPVLAVGVCVDRSHFNYKCVQLAKYCHEPQALRIRSSCPVTCGMCARESLSVQPAIIADFESFGQFNRAAVRRKDIKSGFLDQADTAKLVPLPGGGRFISDEDRFRVLSFRRDPFGRLKQYTTDTTTESTTTTEVKLDSDTTTTEVKLDSNTTTTEVKLDSDTTTTSVSPASKIESIPPSPPERSPFIISPSFAQDGILLLGQLAAAPLPKRDLEEELKICCIDSRMSLRCRSICTYSVSAAEIFEKIVSATCTLEDASKWMLCASGGKENKECCRDKNVIGCDNLCSGVFNITEMMTCTQQHIRPILKCHKETLENSQR